MRCVDSGKETSKLITSVPNVAAVSDDVFMRSSGWLGSQLVSVLGSGAEGPGFKSQLGNSLRQTVHTHRASVHQAAILVAALLRVARVTGGLSESNGTLYRRVYDSSHLQADCQEQGSAPEPYAQ